jgi:hypothetical protein
MGGLVGGVVQRVLHLVGGTVDHFLGPVDGFGGGLLHSLGACVDALGGRNGVRGGGRGVGDGVGRFVHLTVSGTGIKQGTAKRVTPWSIRYGRGRRR